SQDVKVESGGELPEELELEVDDNAQVKGCLAAGGCDAGLTCQSNGRCEECTSSGSCSTTELWSECAVGSTSCASALGSGGICYATSEFVGRCTVGCTKDADCTVLFGSLTACNLTANVCVRPSK
ncbi:MAG TPA: hypothetical protein VF341_01200, partial [Anaeromyxobacteraceae bacterium]